MTSRIASERSQKLVEKLALLPGNGELRSTGDRIQGR